MFLPAESKQGIGLLPDQHVHPIKSCEETTKNYNKNGIESDFLFIIFICHCMF